jgi:hypothetical protein
MEKRKEKGSCGMRQGEAKWVWVYTGWYYHV